MTTFSNSKWRQAGLVAAGLVLFYLLLALALDTQFTQRVPGANDFFPRWMGARALILQGQNPYTDAVTRQIQIGIYGRPAHADEDQVAFAYPLYAAYLAAPLIGLPYDAAQAAWMALLIIAVVAGGLALARVNHIALTPPALATIVLTTLLFYPSVRGIFLGQYALISFALVAFAILALDTRQDVLAGIVLGLSAVKPQPVILLIPVILFWAWGNGRRGMVLSTLATLALLLGSAFVWVPTWFGDFLNALRAYTQYAQLGPPLESFFQLFLPDFFATLLFIIATVLLVVGLAVLLWQNRARSWFEFQPLLGFTALVTVLCAGRIGTPDQVFLLLPLMSLLSAWYLQNKRVAVGLAVTGLLIVPWWIFLSTLHGIREATVVTWILPFATLALLAVVIATRRGWSFA